MFGFRQDYISQWLSSITLCKRSASLVPRQMTLWLRDAHREVIVAVANGMLISIVTGTVFQFHIAANTPYQ
jgi:hypothetical protein